MPQCVAHNSGMHTGRVSTPGIRARHTAYCALTAAGTEGPQICTGKNTCPAATPHTGQPAAASVRPTCRTLQEGYMNQEGQHAARRACRSRQSHRCQQATALLHRPVTLKEMGPHVSTNMCCLCGAQHRQQWQICHMLLCIGQPTQQRHGTTRAAAEAQKHTRGSNNTKLCPCRR